jgi:hypothetical protein
MKTIYKLLALCVIITSSFTTQAQVKHTSRQSLFGRYSSKLPTAEKELDKAFHVPEGSAVTLNFSNFTFTGTVTSSVKRYENLHSVIIKSASLNNSLLSISKRINEDKTVTYVGRIINEKYSDGFELVKDNTGSYALNKIQTEELLQDY